MQRCTYPLTGLACVSRIYTDLAVIDVVPQGLRVVDIAEGLGFDRLQARTGARLFEVERAHGAVALGR